MPVPGYKRFMRPLLEALSDGAEHPVADAYVAASDRLGLTEDDRSELLPSGKQEVWRNRAGWAKTYLAKAGLVDVPRRGIVRITELGRHALKSDETIDSTYLERFESFRKFQGKRSDSDAAVGRLGSAGGTGADDSTPEEALELIYRELRQGLAQELLEYVRSAEPAFFERTVVHLLVTMGYGGSVKDAGRAIGRSGDNGIDGIIKQDRLGLDNVYIQAKRYAEGRTVGSSDVRNLAGALQMHKATKGVLITTSDFTTDAVDTARQIGTIILVNGEVLADLMVEHNIGVTTTATYELKRIDSDFFEDAWGS